MFIGNILELEFLSFSAQLTRASVHHLAKPLASQTAGGRIVRVDRQRLE